MSDSAARIRKQVYELTAQDFLDHAIWEFCSDETGLEGQDEATVRPTNKTELTDELPGACVIAAKVGFADGSWGTGYLYNCRQDDIGCLQPNLLAGASQVNFGWDGCVLSQTLRSGFKSGIGKSARPMTLFSQPPLNQL